MSLVKIEVGQVYPTNEGGTVTVIEYTNCKNILIEHNDENSHRATVTTSRLRGGRIKNPFHRSVSGTGYMGVGKYKTCIDRKITSSHKVWESMIARCYSPVVRAKHPTYKDVTVCEEWHNFQVFSEWFYNQPNAGVKGFEIDKDLTILGNKVYGPEACSFVPREINNLVLTRTAARGEYPLGVRKSNKKFSAYVSVNGRQVHIGVYNSPGEAFLAHKDAKEEIIKTTVNTYRSVLTEAVYQNLINYEVKDD